MRARSQLLLVWGTILAQESGNIQLVAQLLMRHIQLLIQILVKNTNQLQREPSTLITLEIRDLKLSLHFQMEL